MLSPQLKPNQRPDARIEQAFSLKSTIAIKAKQILRIARGPVAITALAAVTAIVVLGAPIVALPLAVIGVVAVAALASVSSTVSARLEWVSDKLWASFVSALPYVTMFFSPVAPALVLGLMLGHAVLMSIFSFFPATEDIWKAIQGEAALLLGVMGTSCIDKAEQWILKFAEAWLSKNLPTGASFFGGDKVASFFASSAIRSAATFLRQQIRKLTGTEAEQSAVPGGGGGNAPPVVNTPADRLRQLLILAVALVPLLFLSLTLKVAAKFSSMISVGIAVHFGVYVILVGTQPMLSKSRMASHFLAALVRIVLIGWVWHYMGIASLKEVGLLVFGILLGWSVHRMIQKFLAPASRRFRAPSVQKGISPNAPWLARVVGYAILGTLRSMRGKISGTHGSFVVSDEHVTCARLSAAAYHPQAVGSLVNEKLPVADKKRHKILALVGNESPASFSMDSFLPICFVSLPAQSAENAPLYITVRGTVNAFDVLRDVDFKPVGIPLDEYPKTVYGRLCKTLRTVTDLPLIGNVCSFLLQGTVLSDIIGANLSFHRGMLRAACALWKLLQSNEAVKAQLAAGRKVQLTGHSLGGGVAVLLGMILSWHGIPVSGVIGFGLPRVFYQYYSVDFSGLREDSILNFVYSSDPVPCLLGCSTLDPVAQILTKEGNIPWMSAGSAAVLQSASQYHGPGTWIQLTEDKISQTEEAALELSISTNVTHHFMTNYLRILNSEKKM